MKRALLLLLLAASPAFSWVESIEFQWNAFPKPLWERELVWMKNIGVRHVSLPTPKSAAEVNDLLRLIRRLALEADIEGDIAPALRDELLPFTQAHGGALSELPKPIIRLSALKPTALIESRKLLAAGGASLIWTDVEDSVGPDGYHAGVVNFAGEEKTGTLPLRRNAQLLHFWAALFPSLHLMPGASTKPAGIAIEQFIAGGNNPGVCAVNLSNHTDKKFEGEIHVLYPPAKKTLSIPNVAVMAHDSLWLPVNIPIGGSAICRSCSAFATTDHLVYATAEMTAMEYENGILAMEFSAPTAAEAILQLSREPSGPYVAGGKPTEFEWDPHTQRLRLAIPAGKGAGNRVRVGLAIEPPEATAFFDTASVLIQGETNSLTAQFSSEQIAKRSRLVAPEGFQISSKVKSPLEITYHILAPDSAVHGDHAELSLEADGAQLSHARPQILRAASLRFPDAVSLRLSPSSSLPLFPATIAVNARSGREIAVSIRNNAPEIRSFDLRLTADGLEFSPASLHVTVGASTAREAKFRVFPTEGAPGPHSGAAVLSGGAYAKEILRFIVVPASGDVSWVSDNFQFVESTRFRASFLGDRWLEFLDKDKNENRLAAPAALPGNRPSVAELERQLVKK